MPCHKEEHRGRGEIQCAVQRESARKRRGGIRRQCQGETQKHCQGRRPSKQMALPAVVVSEMRHQFTSNICINRSDTFYQVQIVKIPLRSFSTWNIRNLQRQYPGILEDGKVRHGILMRTYWKYSSHLRRKFGEGKYLLYISTGKTFCYISFSHFCSFS